MKLKHILLSLFFVFSMLPVFSQQVRKVKITELEKIINESKGPMIINFWATFCVPCIEELPHFQQLTEKYKKDGVQLLLVSLDLEDSYPQKVEAFAAKKNIKNSVWLDETNADYFCPKVDPKWSGAIPATLLINNATGYRKFIEDKVSAERLEKEIMAILGRN